METIENIKNAAKDYMTRLALVQNTNLQIYKDPFDIQQTICFGAGMDNRKRDAPSEFI